eukprot:symbB.v1.2.002702.t1/scaffold145.1/size471898/4
MRRHYEWCPVTYLVYLCQVCHVASYGTPRYPQLNFEAFSVEVLHEEPPVWKLRKFLNAEDCQQLIQEGRQGLRPEKVYAKSRVLFDEDKLRPLVLVAPVLSGGVYGFHDGDLGWTFGALVLGLLATASLRELVRWYVTDVASANGRGGARFSGLKWQLGPLLPGETESQGARGRLLSQVQRLCALADRQYLEPPFLTCYREGEGQGQHVDSKELPNEGWTEEDRQMFEANGKQRMVQCLCYLNSVDVENGGKFLASTAYDMFEMNASGS